MKTRQVGVWEDYEIENESMTSVASKYNLHELQLRALDGRRRLPQALESEDWLTVNFIVPTLANGAIKTDKLSVLISKDKAVTIHKPDGEVMDMILERIELRPKQSQSPTGILAIVADAITDQFTPILDQIDEEIDKIEDVMVKNPTDKQLQQLFHFKQILIDFRRVVIPTTALLDTLSDGRYSLVERKYAMYLRDSYDYSLRAHGYIDTLRDLLTSALDTYLSVVSNRMNDVMKRLTIVTTVFMPISFLASFGGMNFTHMPFHSEAVYFIVLALMFLIPIAMFIFFRRHKWI